MGVTGKRQKRFGRAVRTLLFLCALFQADAHAESEAEEEPPPTRFVIDVQAQDQSDAWFARAMSDRIAREISGYQRIVTFPTKSFACSPCSPTDYQEAGIEVVFLGVLRDEDINFEIVELWTPATVSNGSFSVDNGMSQSRLKRNILGAFQPVLTKGGLLDEKAFLTGTALGPTVPTLGSSLRKHPRGWSAIFGASFLLFAIAALAIVASISDRRGHNLRAVRGWVPSIFITITSAALAIACLAFTPDPLGPDTPRAESWVWLSELFGGVAWAWLLITALPSLVPSLRGFNRVGHRDVVRLVQAWFAVVAERIIIRGILYSPFIAILVAATWSMDLSNRLALLVVTPFWLLLARFWFLVIIEALALILDTEWVSGRATRANVWHDRIAEYIQVFARRTGYSLPPGLFDNVLFLPGQRRGIHSYGGGLAKTRIVVGTGLLEFAMRGPLEEAENEHVFSWADWQAGQIQPVPDDDPIQRAPGLGADLRAQVERFAGQAKSAFDSLSEKRKRRRVDVRARGVKQGIGQIATLLGQVMPSSDALLPLVADTPRDMAVIRELLAEHYDFALLDPNSEYDDGDPTDRDFLFGPLLVEIGRIGRREDRLLTLGSAISTMKSVPGKWYRSVEIFYKRWLSRYSAMLADAYAALNHGRHHLVQYLYCFSERDQSLLSVRAPRADLKAISRYITDAVSEQPPRTEEMGATLHARLIWLSYFSRKQLREQRAYVVRNILYALFAGVAVGGFLAATLRAIDYHPAYVQTLDEERAAIAEENASIKEKEPTVNE